MEGEGSGAALAYRLAAVASQLVALVLAMQKVVGSNPISRFARRSGVGRSRRGQRLPINSL